MTENAKKFLEEISKNEELMEKVDKAGKEEILAIARELNLELSDDDFNNSESEKMSEDELNTVIGAGGCGCFGGGFGTLDGLECACFAAGAGACNSETSYCTGRGNGACACPFAGAGATDGRTCYYSQKGEGRSYYDDQYYRD